MRGRQLPKGGPTYDFTKISQKLYEIERIWTRGHIPRAPFRSATDKDKNMAWFSKNDLFFRHVKF